MDNKADSIPTKQDLVGKRFGINFVNQWTSTVDNFHHFSLITMDLQTIENLVGGKNYNFSFGLLGFGFNIDIRTYG